MKKVLITGANGLVGSQVTRRFAEANFEVFALCRSESDLSLLADISTKIKIIEGDILDIASLEKALENDIDFVVHTAAVVSYSPKDRNNMYKVNVEGTANIVNICLDKKIKKLCYVSSIAALGKPNASTEHTLDGIIDENQKWEDSPLNSHYAKSKYQGELEVWRGQAEGLNTVIVNPSVILGEGDWNKSSTQLFKYVYDEHQFYTEGNLNYVDVKDVVKAIFQLTISDINNERFILNSGTITYREFFVKVAKVFHKNPPTKSISPFLTEILWRIEAIRSFFTQKSPLITKETAKNSRTKFAYKNEKIRQAIGFQFTNFQETILRVCNFLAK
jgi:dihydroflavonol-4-reductase